MNLSNSEVDRLGDRLRSARTISEDDLVMLQRLRNEYETALADAQLVVHGAAAGIQVSSRIKTVHTIVDKLRRESGMKLSRMQDIAGLRLVADMTLGEQDQLAGRVIQALEGDGRIVDRREDPSHGYRALHIYAKVQGRRIEVQIRTRLQDRWAQIVERLADRWGRQIRYGEPPDRPEVGDVAMPRQRVCDLVVRMSEPIAMCEAGTRNTEVGAKVPPIGADFYCREVDNVLHQLASKALRVSDL